MEMIHIHVHGAACPRLMEETEYFTIDVRARVPQTNAMIAKMISTPTSVRSCALTQ